MKIFKNTPNLNFIKCDVCRLPFRDDYFDIAYSQRALHHLPDFESGLKEMARVVKQNNCLSFSVYSRENNEIMIYFVEPLRRFIDRLFGVKGIRALSVVIALLTFPIFKIYFATLKNIKIRFVFHKLFLHWGSMNYSRYKNNIVFDLLHAPKASYLSKAEIASKCEANKIRPEEYFLQHNTVWCVRGRKISA